MHRSKLWGTAPKSRVIEETKDSRQKSSRIDNNKQDDIKFVECPWKKATLLPFFTSMTPAASRRAVRLPQTLDTFRRARGTAGKSMTS
jgi:hypothetical protein